MTTTDDTILRSFDTGATRDTATGKLCYDKFLSPFVLKQYARFMNMNRLQSDGKLRDGDNWQKGIPMGVYTESMHRHFMEMWLMHREGLGDARSVEFVGSMMGLLFNVMGYMHEWLKLHPEIRFDEDEPTMEMAGRQEKVLRDQHEPETATEAAIKEGKRLLDDSEVMTPMLEAYLKFNNLYTELPKVMTFSPPLDINTVGPFTDEPEDVIDLDEELHCDDCKWHDLGHFDHPCDCCGHYDNFVAK